MALIGLCSTSQEGLIMFRILTLTALLALSACGVGQPSVGLNATYDQTTSRSPYDTILIEGRNVHHQGYSR